MLLNLQEVFEAYLRNVLQEHARTHRDIAVFDGNKQAPGGAKKSVLNEEPSEDATPDIVMRCRGADGEFRTTAMY
jgi:hypothetical protein